MASKLEYDHQSFRMSLKKRFSFTASRDWLYRLSFYASGLRSSTTDLGNGTTMHCWVPKCPDDENANLVLLHGFGANAMWQYADVLRHFVSRFNVYVPDLVFFGGSFTTRPDRSEQFQAQCVVGLMAAQGVSKMSLVGISYGGFVAYSVAAQYPYKVERLVLCCSGVCVEEKDMAERLFPVADLEDAVAILVPQTPEKLKELINFSFLKPTKGLPSFFLSDFITVMCTEYYQEKRELIKSILKDRKLSNLKHIDPPTLIIWGDEDQIFPLELGYRLKRHLGDCSRLVLIRNAGHAVHLEKPKEFIKHLKSFLYELSLIP